MKELYLISLFLLGLSQLIFQNVSAQLVTAKPDTVCVGDSSLLVVHDTGARVKYKWSDGQTTDSIWVKPAVTTIDTVIINTGNLLILASVKVYVKNCILGVNNLPDESFFKIYPNPNRGRFTLIVNGHPDSYRVSMVNEGTIEVYNMLGEKVNSQSSNCQMTIDLSAQPEGIYMYLLKSDKGVYIDSGKFVIE